MKLTFKLFLACLFLLLSKPYYGKSIRAMECTSEKVSELTYRFTLSVYTDTIIDDSTSIDISFGIIDYDSSDNLSFLSPITPIITSMTEIIPLLVYENKYVFDYSFWASQTSYNLGALGSFRSDNILNLSMDDSEQQLFIEHYIYIDAFSPINSSPQFNSPSVFSGNNIIFDASASDNNGDSLVYELIIPKGSQGKDINEYVDINTLTEYDDSFMLNEETGEITCNSTNLKGLYNVAIRTYEYRQNVRIGYTDRDIQFIIDGLINSINDYSNQYTFIYPNPTNDQFRITSNYPISKTTITDINGKILSTQLHNNEKSLSLKLEGNTGIYFVKINTTQTEKTYKIVKTD